MNTSTVAKMLGVSPSTIQRWVKQANLQMDRTELGHYQFSEESIEILKDIQNQLNNGVLLQDLKLKGKKSRQAAVLTGANDLNFQKVIQRIEELEKKVNGKADDVVSYQILQHRREIEDLHNEVSRLNEVIMGMEEAAVHKEPLQNIEKGREFPPEAKFKKWKIISSLFGF